MPIDYTPPPNLCSMLTFNFILLGTWASRKQLGQDTEGLKNETMGPQSTFLTFSVMRRQPSMVPHMN